MSGKVGIGAGIAAGVGVIGGLLYFALAPVESADVGDTERASREAKTERVPKHRKVLDTVTPFVGAKKNGQDKAKRERKARMQMPEDWFAKLPAKDRAMAKRIQDAQDADDQAAVLKVAEEAVDSKNAEVRSAAVEALSLQGSAAMPVLLKFVGDGNKDVADAAYRAWDDAVDTVDGDLNKLGAVKQLLDVAKEGEHVKSAVGKIEMFDQARAIRELAKLARADGKAAAAAKESYENVTGEPFKSWADAELKAIAIDRDNISDE